MNRRDRQKRILNLIKSQFEMSVREASDLLQVSTATIRRDFEDLVDKGLAKKIWGGIMAKSGSGINHVMLPVGIRETQLTEEKKRIAQKGASLVKNGDVLIIDGGTTTLAMAPFLANRKVKIITNSILIAYQIYKERDSDSGAEVFLTGGLLFPDSGLLVGPQTSENIHQFNADIGFISVGGIDEGAATNTDQLVVANERAIIQQSRKVVMLADHSKFGKKDMCRICSLSEVDILISDEHKSILPQLRSLSRSGLKVIAV
jgi:DeoR/GlpR family transcriptional regulator of sugar metabolism